MERERVPAYQILVNNKDLSDARYNKIEEVVYEQPENGEEFFEIKFTDGDCSILDSGLFKKDSTQCALFMGYIGDMEYLMDGVVTGITPDFPQTDAPTLKITVKNTSAKMNRQSQSCSWKGKTYSDIAKLIAKKYGLKANVQNTSSVFKANSESCIYQTGMSDYMFLAVCARKIGYTFAIQDNTLFFRHTVTHNDTVYLDYRMGGCNLLTFRPNADSTNRAQQYYSNNVELSTADPDVDFSTSPAKASVSTSTTKSSSPSPQRTYTVVKGDYLIKIAKQMYGDGSRYIDIYNANASKIKMPGYWIYPGQVFVIP